MDLTRYLGLFVTDAREQLGHLESDLIRLEQPAVDDTRAALLDAVFRHLHSLKGSAAAMGFEVIGRTAHLAEQLVSSLRESRRLEPGHIDLLLETTATLRRLVETAAGGHTLLPDEGLLFRLGGGSGGSGAPSRPPVERRAGTPETTVHIRVSPRSATPGARAFVVLRRLEALAEIVSTVPSRDELREVGLSGHVLTVTMKGHQDLAVLRQAIVRIPDIEALELAGDRRIPAAAAPSRATPAQRAPAEQTIRVKVDLLDQLLELAGELVLSSARLRETTRRRANDKEGGREVPEGEIDKLGRLVKELNTRVLAARQTPVQLLADRLPPVVRDLSRRLKKPLQLQVSGGDVTLDRGLLDALADPLTHALRNAADHGIETPDVRLALGKPANGTLTFSARRERDHVVLELSDDGAGFDIAGLRTRALSAGAITPTQAAAMTDDEALRLAFLPGVSTRAESGDISGRGVGMDAVLVAIEQLGGTVTIHSSLGNGSSLLFSLPTSLSVTNLLLIDLGGEIMGLPMSKILLATEGEPALSGPESSGARVLQLGDEDIPAYPLGRLIGLEDRVHGRRPFVVVEGEGQRTAVGVDRLLGQEEVVMRPLAPPLEKIRGLAGTAILGSGRPILVLDVPRLVA